MSAFNLSEATSRFVELLDKMDGVDEKGLFEPLANRFYTQHGQPLYESFQAMHWPRASVVDLLTTRLSEFSDYLRLDEFGDRLSEETISPAKREATPLVRTPIFKGKVSHTRPIQQWEGVVSEVYDDYFVASLRDRERLTPDEYAEIFLSEVSEEDLPLVRPGNVFYWNIGYYDSPDGQRRRSSAIRFRRLPVWTKQEVARFRAQAAEASEILGWGQKADFGSAAENGN